MDKKHQIVFSRGLCNYLIGKGFHVVDVGQHKERENECVFFFVYTERLKEAIDNFMIINGKQMRN